MHAAAELNQARALIRAQLGADQLRELHRPDRRLDAMGVGACWGAAALLFALLATLPLGLPWALLFVLQGFALQAFGLLGHDAFVHRRIWGDRWSWVGSMICFFPVLIRPTLYAIAHQDHHRHLGSAGDTETYKQTLDARWKRLLFLTLLGDRMAKRGRFAGPGIAMPAIAARSPLQARRLAAEGIGLCGFLALVAAAAVLWPAAVLCGYVLPLLIVTPAASTLRVVLEHAETNAANPFHCATFYRTGPITRLLFVADAGDCHLVHHLFSHIPWYRMAAATDLMRPVLLAHGVVERRSLAQLLRGWFVACFPHRSLWFQDISACVRHPAPARLAGAASPPRQREEACKAFVRHRACSAG